MVQMRVRHEYMIDARQLVDTEIADSGSGVDQDVVVEQHGGGAQITADAAAAAEYPELHSRHFYFVLNVNAPSQPLPGGFARKYEILSTNV